MAHHYRCCAVGSDQYCGSSNQIATGGNGCQNKTSRTAPTTPISFTQVSTTTAGWMGSPPLPSTLQLHRVRYAILLSWMALGIVHYHYHITTTQHGGWYSAHYHWNLQVVQHHHYLPLWDPSDQLFELDQPLYRSAIGARARITGARAATLLFKQSRRQRSSSSDGNNQIDLSDNNQQQATAMVELAAALASDQQLMDNSS